MSELPFVAAPWRAIQQRLEGLCPEAVARVEGVHPTTVQRWVDPACVQAKAADQKVITGVSTQNDELDELHSFFFCSRIVFRTTQACLLPLNHFKDQLRSTTEPDL